MDGALVGWAKTENHIPWWASICGACAAFSFDMALPPGAWIASFAGILLLIVGLRAGHLSHWRVFGLFDRRDADRVPHVYQPSLAAMNAAAVFGRHTGTTRESASQADAADARNLALNGYVTPPVDYLSETVSVPVHTPSQGRVLRTARRNLVFAILAALAGVGFWAAGTSSKGEAWIGGMLLVLVVLACVLLALVAAVSSVIGFLRAAVDRH